MQCAIYLSTYLQGGAHIQVEQLVVPKHHGAKLTDIPDETLTEILACIAWPNEKAGICCRGTIC